MAVFLPGLFIYTSFFTPVTPTRVNLKLEGEGLDCTSGKSIDLIYNHPTFKISIILINVRIQLSFAKSKIIPLFIRKSYFAAVA